MVEYCCGFAFNHNRSLLLLIEKQKPEWQRDKWNGVGGKVEEGETAVDAMVREFKEETGSATKKGDWTHFLDLFGGDWVVRFYYSELSHLISIDLNHNKEEQLFLCDPRQLPPVVIPNLKWIVPLSYDQSVRHPITVIDEWRSHESGSKKD